MSNRLAGIEREERRVKAFWAIQFAPITATLFLFAVPGLEAIRTSLLTVFALVGIVVTPIAIVLNLLWMFDRKVSGEIKLLLVLILLTHIAILGLVTFGISNLPRL